MLLTNKLLPVALIAALVGGSVGAFFMSGRTSSTSAAANNETPQAQTTANTDQFVPGQFTTPGEQSAYKTGFADGFGAATQTSNNVYQTVQPRRVVYRSAASSTPRRVYYDYGRPQGRSFWQKHRDKLTLAMGTGAGAGLGALIGGKKGTLIGGLAGAGGSALYTYKLRNRNPRY